MNWLCALWRKPIVNTTLYPVALTGVARILNWHQNPKRLGLMPKCDIILRDDFGGSQLG